MQLGEVGIPIGIKDSEAESAGSIPSEYDSQEEMQMQEQINVPFQSLVHSNNLLLKAVIQDKRLEEQKSNPNFNGVKCLHTRQKSLVARQVASREIT